MNTRRIRASFTNFPQNKPKKSIHLFNVISSGNHNQADDFFDGFVSIVNQQQMSIAKVTIIDSTDLARHYKVDKKSLIAPGEKSDWQKKHEIACKSIVVPWELISWGTTLLERDDYKKHAKNIREDYEGADNNFKKIVDKVAECHLKKGAYNDVVNFLLEECAGALTLDTLALDLESEAKTSGKIPKESQIIERHITYPGGLNEAIQYALRKYRSSLKQQNYRLKVSESKNNFKNLGLFEKEMANPMQIHTLGLTPFEIEAANYVRILNRLPPQQKQKFFLELRALCDNFDKSNDTLGNANEPQINRTTISSSAC